jgi:hypothetical protein
VCIAALAAACATSTPKGEEQTTAAPTPTTPEPPAMTKSQRETPWTINYADGSANQYTFTQSAAGGEVSFEYDPVTPERSSTGSYSGGDPHKAQLAADDPRIEELWSRVEKAEADTANHAPDRNKGTGAFSLVTPSGSRTFIVEMGPALNQLHEFMVQFRK